MQTSLPTHRSCRAGRADGVPFRALGFPCHPLHRVVRSPAQISPEHCLSRPEPQVDTEPPGSALVPERLRPQTLAVKEPQRKPRAGMRKRASFTSRSIFAAVPKQLTRSHHQRQDIGRSANRSIQQHASHAWRSPITAIGRTWQLKGVVLPASASCRISSQWIVAYWNTVSESRLAEPPTRTLQLFHDCNTTGS
jgi:hypothetical protein